MIVSRSFQQKTRRRGNCRGEKRGEIWKDFSRGGLRKGRRVIRRNNKVGKPDACSLVYGFSERSNTYRVGK